MSFWSWFSSWWRASPTARAVREDPLIREILKALLKRFLQLLASIIMKRSAGL
jgi:hypothetical protein